MTNAELAILSLIAEQPRHGYEIEQVIEQRGMRDWTEIGFSSIYYILKKLEENGWVASQAAQPVGRGPARKVYHLTAEGEAAWAAGVRQALSEPEPCYSPLLVGLSNLAGIPQTAAREALQGYAAALAVRRDHVRHRARSPEPLPLHVEAMFEFSLALIEAELGWVTEFIQKMEARNE
jgi:DNA-binding PadR family transcriptional regulator